MTAYETAVTVTVRIFGSDCVEVTPFSAPSTIGMGGKQIVTTWEQGIFVSLDQHIATAYETDVTVTVRIFDCDCVEVTPFNTPSPIGEGREANSYNLGTRRIRLS